MLKRKRGTTVLLNNWLLQLPASFISFHQEIMDANTCATPVYKNNREKFALSRIQSICKKANPRIYISFRLHGNFMSRSPAPGIDTETDNRRRKKWQNLPARNPQPQQYSNPGPLAEPEKLSYKHQNYLWTISKPGRTVRCSAACSSCNNKKLIIYPPPKTVEAAEEIW